MNDKDIITQKDKKDKNDLENLVTLLMLEVAGDGEELFEYNLPHPHKYIRNNEKYYTLHYILDGVFFTKKGLNFINDILLRFNLSFKIININYKVIKKQPNTKTYKLNMFNNLNSKNKEFILPNHIKKDDAVFWGIKLYVESMLNNGSGFIPFETLLNYGLTHYIDTKDYSTIKSKCRSIWNWYNDRNWEQTEKTKKYNNNKEKYEGTKMSRIEIINKLNEERKEKSYKKIINAITGVYKDDFKKKNGKWNYKKIAEYLKIDYRTVSKHIKKYEELNNN